MRSLPVWERHPHIFHCFDDLTVGRELEIVTDHEPRPLHAEFEERRAGLFSWSQRLLGDGRWEARILKTTVDADATIGLLHRTSPFSQATDAALRDLADRARTTAIRRDRTIVEQGVMWPYVGIVAGGSVQGAVATPDGRELGVHDVLPGELFGVTALLDGGPSALRYVARGAATTVVLLPISAVTPVFQREPAVRAAAVAVGAQQTRNLIEHLGTYAARPISARIALVLLSYARPERGLVAPLPPLREMRQIDLAIAAGTAKDMVYRVLSDFESAGALTRKRGRIVALERSRLLSLAQGVKYE